jgi:hypothetical protein
LVNIDESASVACIYGALKAILDGKNELGILRLRLVRKELEHSASARNQIFPEVPRRQRAHALF